MYLCHTFCELGATRLDEVLDDIHEFLVTHPGEIVVMVNQDYVTPADFVGAMRDAGPGAHRVRRPRRAATWPTLREMVDADTRLVVLAENEAGAAPWYQLAYERLTSRRRRTRSAGRRSSSTRRRCRELRAEPRPGGRADVPPQPLGQHRPGAAPSDAAQVNAYDPLLRRARECARIRGHVPNLSRSTSTAAATSSGSSTRSTACSAPGVD